MFSKFKFNAFWRWLVTLTCAIPLMVMLLVTSASAQESTAADDSVPPVSIKQFQLGQTVPASVIVTYNGLEWVWASPCALNGCATGIDVGHDGFVFATEAQWTLKPPVSAFRNPDKCASPWFDHVYNHCDWGDPEFLGGVISGRGLYGSAQNGGLPAGPTGINPMYPIAETWLVRVVNLPPTADAGGPYLVAVGAQVTFDSSGSSDPDGDFLSEIWAANGGTVSGSTYTAGFVPGIYDVTLIVDDGNGGTDSAMTTVVVYDPSGGFVTGGGWIESQYGAYILDPYLTGKANFGFVSKYNKGANVPTGQTEFHFKAGNLNFHSDSYQWLVINQNGENAQYKGTGTVNGTGNFGFMLWAGDNGSSSDTFRIKIWDKDNSDTVIYDNGFDQYIGGGQIAIHKK